MLTPKKKRILFITHDASYTGAPIVLLNLIRLLKEDDKVSINLIIARGGPLKGAFEESADSIMLKPGDYSIMPKGWKWFRYFILNKINTVRMFFTAFSCDIIFANTVVTARLTRMLRYLRKPVVMYVHELENILDFYSTQKSGPYFFKETNLFVYPGHAIGLLLKNKYNISPNRLKNLNAYIPFDSPEDKDRNRIPFSSKEFIVCGVGTASLRKGTDIFIEVARLVCEQTDNIKFTWIGSFENEALKNEWTSKVKAYGLEDRFSFSGPYQPSEMKWLYMDFDLLFLSSREDPYPLVVLEAGYCKLPSLIFKPAGGITEFVDEDAGWQLEDFSVEKAAEKIISISHDRNDIKQKGKKAKSRVQEWHINKALILNQFYDAINNIPAK